MELLLHWMRKQEIDDKMIYKKAAIKQECFLRDWINALFAEKYPLNNLSIKTLASDRENLSEAIFFF